MDKNNEFAENLSALIEEHGLSAEKISALTGIPGTYISGILSGDPKRLPSAPYVRGYLAKIGDLIGEDGQALWSAYKEEHSLKSSGTYDRLPSNRFASKPSVPLSIAVGVVVLALLSCLAYWGIKAIRAPQISIYGPEDNFVANASSVVLSGKINADDKLLINNEEIAPEKTGGFEKEFLLEAGVNTFEFRIKRFLGKESKVVRRVIYQPEEKNDQNEETQN